MDFQITCYQDAEYIRAGEIVLAKSWVRKIELFQLYKNLVKECVLYNAGAFCVGKNNDLCHYRRLVKNSSSIFRTVQCVIEQTERLAHLV
jgi:hypothetical protein